MKLVQLATKFPCDDLFWHISALVVQEVDALPETESGLDILKPRAISKTE